MVSAGLPPISARRRGGGIDIIASHRNAGIEQALGIDLAHEAQTDNGDGSRIHCRTLRAGFAFGFTLFARRLRRKQRNHRAFDRGLAGWRG